MIIYLPLCSCREENDTESIICPNSVTVARTIQMLGVAPGYTKELIDIHAQCKPIILISISATVALMFLAGKQSLSCQVWRAKPPN